MAKIAIAIVTYNAMDRIDQCLRSLSESLQAFSSDPGEGQLNDLVTNPVKCSVFVQANLQVEVGIWDNGTDGTGGWAQANYPQFKVFSDGANIGFNAANNKLYDKLRPEKYLVLLNDDTVVDPAWLGELVAAAEGDPHVMIVQSQLRLLPEKDRLNSWGNNIHFLGYGYTGGHKTRVSDAGLRLSGLPEIGYASGAAMLVKVALLKQTPLFDDSFFMYHEDLDLGWRARLLGYKTVLAPKSVVYHKYSFKKSLAKFFYMERNRFIVMLKNYHWLTLLAILPMLVFMEAGTFGYSLFTGWYQEKLKVYKYLLTPSSWRKILADRALIQSSRRVSDSNVTRVFVGDVAFQDLQNPVLTYIVNPLTRIYWFCLKLIMFW